MGDLISSVSSGIGSLFNDITSIPSDIGSLLGGSAQAATPGVISQVPASPDISALAGQLEGAPANTGGIFDLLPVGGSISATLGGAPIGGAGGYAGSPAGITGGGGSISATPGGLPIGVAPDLNVMSPSVTIPPTTAGGVNLGSEPLGGGLSDLLSGFSPSGPAAPSGGTSPTTAGGLFSDIKPYLPLLTGLGSILFSSFNKPAIPGVGKALAPGGSSVGQQVGIANTDQEIAGLQRALATQQQGYAPLLTDISNLQSVTGQGLIGPGQAQVTAAAAGQLPPAQQAEVDQSLQAAQAQIKSTYANLGLSGSTMEAQDLDSAAQQAQAFKAQLLLQNEQAGGALVGQGQAGLSGAAGAINNAVAALANAGGSYSAAAGALGNAANIYGNITSYQLAADQGLQEALALLAAGSGRALAGS